MNEQLRRIQFVTQYYDWLQGLRFLPMGLALMGFAVWMLLAPVSEGKPSPSPVGGAVLMGGLVVALVLYSVLGRYYRRRFGEVRPSETTRRTRRMMMLTFLLAGLVVSQGFILLGGRGPGQPLPVPQGLVLCSLALVAYWAWTGGFVRHYLPVAGAMAAVGLLHHLGLNPFCALHAADAVAVRRCDIVTLHAVTGLSLVVASVLDHRLLVRTLRPALPQEDASEPSSEPDETQREAAG